MLTRYSVAALSLFLWAGLTVVAWWNDPLAYTGLLGQPSTALLVGGIGFVVFGTLYHVVPFIIGSTGTATASASRTFRWSMTCTTTASRR